ncbi:MAG: FAD-binding protein [Gammaproteobacteria bacterium]|nr:FAD-binding protein [Gammaproteobacteria bacterium]
MLDQQALVQLSTIKGISAFYTDKTDCLVYGYDNSKNLVLPDAVIFPTTHEQVVNIVAICYQFSIPITARGRGTATTGAAVPVRSGLVMSLEKMNKVISFEADNRLITVQPGITNQAVQDLIKNKGFFWPPDPSSSEFCSVGGNLSCNSAGPRAVKYGTTRDHVLGLTFVTGEGKTIKTGAKTTKSVVGYDFTRLIIGAEGSLGIITEATLKLLPLPETKLTAKIFFSSIQQATQAIKKIMAQPVIPCALEFIDKHAIDMIRDYSDVDLPNNAGALIMLELDGDQTAILSQANKLETIINDSGCVSINWAKTEIEINDIWKTRKALSPALRKIAPKKINEDVVVPVANIPTLLNGIEQLSERYQIAIVNFGHAGNGNIHVNLLTDPDDESKLSKAYQCLDELFDLVLKLDGTLSGEHGIGLEKMKHVKKELDDNYISLMKAVKLQFDPKLILNPGKQDY